jgi:hypothetical protein
MIRFENSSAIRNFLGWKYKERLTYNSEMESKRFINL